MRIAVLAAVLLTAGLAAEAGELRGLGTTGPLRSGVDRQPGAARYGLQRLDRDLPRGTSIEEGRARWQLDELRRDADRNLRAARRPPTVLPPQPKPSPPHEAGIDGRELILGTGKAGVRIEGVGEGDRPVTR